jgi:hypothetical protein
MRPEEVTYTTDLDRQYVAVVKGINSPEKLEKLLADWGYWLDDEVKELKAEDWPSLKPLIDDCRTEGVWPEKKHDVAIALLMPKRIINVSFIAHYFGVPWGCAYIRMKEEKSINY